MDELISIENISTSLVREYLSRKGLKETLKTMDVECPRTDTSINNRAQLVREAHIEKLIKKNKEQSAPLRAMIEVMTKYFVDRASSGRPTSRLDTTNSAANKQQSKSSASSTLTDLGGYPQGDLPSSPVETATSRNSGTATTSQKPSKHRPVSHQQVDSSSKLESVEPVSENDTKKPLRATSDSPVKKAGVRPSSGSGRQRGLSGPITSSHDLDRDRAKKGKKTPSSRAAAADLSLTSRESSNGNSPENSESLLTSSPTKPAPPVTIGNDLFDNVQTPVPSQDSSVRPRPKSARIVTRTKSSEGRSSEVRQDFGGAAPEEISDLASVTAGRTMGTEDAAPTQAAGMTLMPSPPSVAKKQHGRSSLQSFGDVEFGDIDEDESQPSNLSWQPTMPRQIKAITDAKPITLQQAMDLKNLIFGSSSAVYVDEWRFQNFGFSKHPKLTYGIVQHKGGPCGVLACVQACLLRQLLFSLRPEKMPGKDCLHPDSSDRSQLLATAIAHILWRAGDNKQATVALVSGRSIYSGGGRYKPDYITETLVLTHFTDYDRLASFTKSNIGLFEEDQSPAAIMLLYSAILSRTIEGVRKDMDEPLGKLMGAHNYCTQEMVNLLLTGHAVSNVFNDVVELSSDGGSDSVLLRGISSRSNIGFLSLFEYYGSCQVGSNYKTPRFPIWVVCSESHFSVVFSLKKELLGDWKVERRFDLFYYDGLARQDEEIRLTIETTRPYTPPAEDDLVPPLEHCIRTKWSDAIIEWNGTEPIL